MKQSWRLALGVVLLAGFTGFALMGQNAQPAAGAKAAPKEAAKQTAKAAAKPAFQSSGEFFKNVTTGPLKGLSVDDFLGTMGVLTDDLGLDCSNCHPGAGGDNADFVIDTPIKKTARRMIEMVGDINRRNFAGAQAVTCWTCHHGRIKPSTTIALETVYDTPNKENDDLILNDRSAPPATQVLDKFITALGGQQKLDAIKSFVATGDSIGFAGLGGKAEFTIFANAPNQRVVRIRYPQTTRDASMWGFNGTTGWVDTPRALVGSYEIFGGERDGARLEAQLAFPGNIKNVLTSWRSGGLQSLGDKDYQVLQGSGPRGLMATLYFDVETGLLARLVRYAPSPIGRMPTQIDYSDYRDVNGVKFPFTYTFLWLDGRYTAKISSVKVNEKIDPALFVKPAAAKGASN